LHSAPLPSEVLEITTLLIISVLSDPRRIQSSASFDYRSPLLVDRYDELLGFILLLRLLANALGPESFGSIRTQRSSQNPFDLNT
jgi:hypothetical protein